MEVRNSNVIESTYEKNEQELDKKTSFLFQPFVGKSDKSGSHFCHCNSVGAKVVKVEKITTHQHFPDIKSSFRFFRKNW